jgi:hemerythrin-like metal-binding protein
MNMIFFQWNESLSVGIEKIDMQHKKLISLINDLYQAMTSGKGKEELDKIFKELFDYVKTHFFDEEKLMFVHHYEGYEAHKREHQKFSEQLKKYKEKFDKGDRKIAIEVSDFLKEWLVNHIMKTDQQYAPYLKERIRKDS